MKSFGVWEWGVLSLLDAIQKGRAIHEDVAQDLPSRGLIEGEYPNYSISLSFAKITKQLPTYTRQKGLDKPKLKQMVLQFLQNAGDEGAKRNLIHEYLKDVLPQNRTEEQQLRAVGKLLVEMIDEGLVENVGVKWFIKG